jgi:hypothetical protein
MASSTHKPPIYLALIFPIYLGGAAILLWLLLGAYTLRMGIAPQVIPNRNGLLIALPVVFLWIPLSLLLSNALLHAVPALRAIAERYARLSSHPGFAESQRQLLKLAGVVAVVCVPLIALDFWL